MIIADHSRSLLLFTTLSYHDINYIFLPVSIICHVNIIDPKLKKLTLSTNGTNVKNIVAMLRPPAPTTSGLVLRLSIVLDLMQPAFNCCTIQRPLLYKIFRYLYSSTTYKYSIWKSLKNIIGIALYIYLIVIKLVH